MDEYSNAVNRMNNNIKDKWVELANEIDDFVKSKLVEMESFIESHNDCFFDENSVCPACGKSLEFGEDFMKVKN